MYLVPGKVHTATQLALATTKITSYSIQFDKRQAKTKDEMIFLVANAAKALILLFVLGKWYVNGIDSGYHVARLIPHLVLFTVYHVCLFLLCCCAAVVCCW